MTMKERVLELLKKHYPHPMTVDEIAELLSLKVRKDIYGKKAYWWGNWSFKDAEDEGLIEWVGGPPEGWRLVKK